MTKGLVSLFLSLTPFFGLQAAISPLQCVATAVPPVVPTEAASARLGDIVLNCSQGVPGGTVTANLQVFLTVNVTNKLSAIGTADAVLTVDTGSGPVSAGASATVPTANSLAFATLNFTLPSSGQATLRISNLRGAVHQRPEGQTVIAFLAATGPSGITVQNNQLPVAISQRGLLASSSSASIVCVGSPLPETTDFPNLLAAGTRYSSLRVTEGFSEAFEKRQPMTDSGVRVVFRYSDFPEGARLFVPNAIAGSSAVEPTSAGDLGLPASGGKHASGSAGSLLLARVVFTDADGAGGSPVFAPGPPGSGTVSLDRVSEIPLVNGAGMAVYEVVDSNPLVLESAQVPTFLGIPPILDGRTVIASQQVSLGPVSLTAEASVTAPVPRFLASAPPNDCSALRDCNASYFPRLLVFSEPLEYTAPAGSAFQIRYVRVNNDSGGLLNWTATVSYQTGSDWLRVFPTSGQNNATIRVDALPEKLVPGLYEATLTIDAGPLAGSRTLPVTLRVTALPPPPPVVESVTNAASFLEGPLVAGSLATVKGSRLAGASVIVTVGGLTARLLYNDDRQINLLVPEELATATAAQLVVTVDGRSSAPVRVSLAPIAPAIFSNGILNQDSSVNSVTNPALAGSIVQIFATGLPLPGGGTISARIHDREIFDPYYGGPAPGLAGVQQVNIAIPEDLPAMTTEVLVCGSPVSNPTARTCSRPVRITLRR